jgi:hypothetical protein
MADNPLIAALAPRERQRLLARCALVSLRAGEVLADCGDPVRQLHFPCGATVALMVQVDGHPAMAAGMVDLDGLPALPLQPLAPAGTAPPRAPWRMQVQTPGQAWRIPLAGLRQALDLSPALQRCLDRHALDLVAALARNAACARFHQIGPRLARWLLMTQDSAQADTFALTHALLADMLGVRRVGITVAAGAMQAAGLIDYHRGQLRIAHRAGLALAACGCYRADRAWAAR